MAGSNEAHLKSVMLARRGLLSEAVAMLALTAFWLMKQLAAVTAAVEWSAPLLAGVALQGWKCSVFRLVIEGTALAVLWVALIRATKVALPAWCGSRRRHWLVATVQAAPAVSVLAGYCCLACGGAVQPIMQPSVQPHIEELVPLFLLLVRRCIIIPGFLVTLLPLSNRHIT